MNGKLKRLNEQEKKELIAEWIMKQLMIGTDKFVLNEWMID